MAARVGSYVKKKIRGNESKKATEEEDSSRGVRKKSSFGGFGRGQPARGDGKSFGWWLRKKVGEGFE